MTDPKPLTDQQLTEIAGRAAGLYEYATGLDTAWQDEADQLTGEDVPALLAELHAVRSEREDLKKKFAEAAASLAEQVQRYGRRQREHNADREEMEQLRAALEEIRHLHKDSPMGPCPVCIDADAIAAGGDGLMPYPCPTGRLAGAQDCEPPHMRAAAEEQPADPRQPFRFVDDDGDYLHIGIPASPANGGPAVSFHTETEPVHLPVDRIDEVIATLRRLKAAQQ